jgi:hypothetical protein
MKTFLFALSLVFVASAQAAIVCEGKYVDYFDTEYPIKVTIDSVNRNRSNITVEYPSAPRAVYRNVVRTWDGHKTGLFSAPGIAVKYENHFGAINDVVVIVDVNPTIRMISTVEIPGCSGSAN